MKINKIAGICKRANLIKLYDEPDGSDVQWCGTDAVIYPLYSLPVLDSDTVGPVMSITDKEMKKIVVEHESVPDYYDISDNAVGEKLLNGFLIRIVIGNTIYNAYQRQCESGLLFINSEYLNIMYIPGTGEVAVFMSVFVGALLGFLWYHSYPAQGFMGDTGRLAIVGIIGGLLTNSDVDDE